MDKSDDRKLLQLHGEVLVEKSGVLTCMQSCSSCLALLLFSLTAESLLKRMDRDTASHGCLEIWTGEHYNIVHKCKAACRAQKGTQQKEALKQCHSELRKLLQKMQGLPPAVSSVPLELSVLYNASVLNLRLSANTREEDQAGITQALLRALEAAGRHGTGSDSLQLWRLVLQLLNWEHWEQWEPSLTRLACVQWAHWLCTCQLHCVRELLLWLAESQGWSLPACPGSPLDVQSVLAEECQSWESRAAPGEVLSAAQFRELLHTCTAITQGVEWMEAGQYQEALGGFQQAAALPSPRPLHAQLLTLTGLCFLKLGKPQSGLQCYRQALEMDFGCLCALYQSCVVYRQLGEAEAEIEALGLLYTAVMLPAHCDPACDSAALIGPESLLQSPTLISLLRKPHPFCVKHCLAQRSLQSGRTAEAVEHYLDLLASFQEGASQRVIVDNSLAFPRIPELYLEAAVSLLKARRYQDAITVCEEVVSKTGALVPERLTLECPPNTERDGLWAGESEKRESLNCVLWTAAACFLQGQAFTQLKEGKESLSHYSRCINLLVKVHVTYSERQGGDSEQSGVRSLQRLKSLAFTGRGLCFLERAQDREALHSFQLSVQTDPGVVEGLYWLLELLWRLGRREEALSCWRTFQSCTGRSAEEAASAAGQDLQGDYPLYLLPPLQGDAPRDWEGLSRRMLEECSPL
ncbi:Fanconi anemia group G protein [Acipenser oxyrinchus oxyrinchus]|uniref:Fanconi anemia group G protein n=1 Tax=Acipenser oxyrinchus oxyrinchus TaxID=40147 RepID=A0AAD8LVD0_ACIOX|nr:Fanconi anemia group G protein [Acipenser oxyrinchus oxyrinchus]